MPVETRKTYGELTSAIEDMLIDAARGIRKAAGREPVTDDDLAKRDIKDALDSLQAALDAIDQRAEAYEAAQDPDGRRDCHAREE